MTTCPKCNRQWPDTSEQAAAVRIYQRCIVCCVDSEKSEGFDWNVEKVVEEAALAKARGETGESGGG
jgi:hypothetical protein